MVRAVRKGASVREVAGRFRVSVGTVVHWVSQAHGKRLDRVSFRLQAWPSVESHP